jgi:hypothetical protein
MTKPVTNRDILVHVDAEMAEARTELRAGWQLEMRAFRAEVRLLILASVIAGQTLARIDVPSEVTTIAGLAVVAKLAFGWLAR